MKKLVTVLLSFGWILLAGTSALAQAERLREVSQGNSSLAADLRVDRVQQPRALVAAVQPEPFKVAIERANTALEGRGLRTPSSQTSQAGEPRLIKPACSDPCVPSYSPQNPVYAANNSADGLGVVWPVRF
ncbi:hypothetical protein [Kamptonema formosum]|uniref:hypothetical protein n=1 Tax=Kamptonema formosum TaxID=331992 RepID=UPI00034663C8|nr:hypothetical protein [Oscillatoria sp. PCC 10802]